MIDWDRKRLIFFGFFYLHLSLNDPYFRICRRKGQRQKQSVVITEIELQSMLMSYADRFSSVLTQAFEDFDALSPSPESRRFVLDDMVHVMSAMFTEERTPKEAKND